MDYKSIISELGNKKAIYIYQKMLEIREFEKKISFLFLEGRMPGTIHQYTGMEACAVGVCSVLKQNDVIGSTHRPNGHAIARGLSMEEIIAELFGKVTGCCKGKGGAMHIGDIDKGMLPAIAVVGGNIPIIMGAALAFKLKREKKIAVSFFGDGASNTGAFHEGLNMAAVYNLPVVFVCENNHYSASTSIKKTLKIENIADRAQSYRMRGEIANGMDVLNVYMKAKKAADLARKGEGPTLLELKTFRFCGHSRRDPNNYMPREEMEYWKKKDPIPFYEKILLKESIINEDKIEKIKKIVDKKVDRAVQFGQQSLEPNPEDTFDDLYVTIEVPK